MSDTNRSVREEMIRLYQLKKLGFDFMGYTFNNKGQLSYHHLIVPTYNHHSFINFRSYAHNNL